MKNLTLYILVIFLFCFGCKKMDGYVKVTYKDKLTGLGISGIRVDINQSDGGLGSPVARVLKLTTDANGSCLVTRDVLPDKDDNKIVFASLITDSSDSLKIEYQYLPQAAGIEYPYDKDVVAYANPSGAINFTYWPDFWDNKTYDTILIVSEFGKDTLTKSSLYGKGYSGTPSPVRRFDFISIKNGVEDTVHTVETPLLHLGVHHYDYCPCCYYLPF